MATFTENYDLIKPDGDDYYDVADFNENMDALDGLMAAAEQITAAVEQGMADIAEKIGTPAETGQTLFSLLQGGSVTFASLFKSVQRVTISSPTESVKINTVDPSKCLVFVERLYDQYEEMQHYDYVLQANQIKLTEHPSSSKTLILAFTVVEFY